MNKIIFTILLLMFVYNSYTQSFNTDSLETGVASNETINRDKIEFCLKLCSEFHYKNIEKLKKYSFLGLQFAEKENDKKNVSNFYMYIGIGYNLYGKLDSAMFYFQKGLDLATETENKKCESAIYRKKSYIHTKNIEYKDYNLALEYLLKALQISEETGNIQEIASSLYSIGEYHRILRNFERSIYYLEQAKKIAEEIDYDYVKIRIYYALGEIYHEKKELDLSFEYINKMYVLSMKNGDKIGEILSLQSLTYYYCLGRKEFDTAEKYALECLKVAYEFKGKIELISAYTALSFVYLYQKRYEECKKTVLKAWELDSLNLQLSTLTNLAAAYLYAGELDEAHDFFVRYVYLIEEFSGKQFQKGIADMETKYETEKKEVRIATLEKERKLYTWLVISGAIVILLMLFLLFVRHRINVQKRELSEQKIIQLEQEKQLITTKAVLDGESSERSRLARDLHDGLGGMLSVAKLNLKEVKNYGIMETSDIERFAKAIDMIDQSIAELRRIAHHIMPESLMHYGLKVSLEDFCNAIPCAHFHFFGEEIRLDSRLEILIYRCAFELINNALKHSNAKTINVQLMIEKNLISLTVHDDGKGFDAKNIKHGIGLENIHNRIDLYNGKMKIISSPEEGTEISIEIEQP